MASASKNTTLTSNNGYGYTLTSEFSEGTPNVANNYSPVTCTATLKSNGASWSSNYNSTLSIYWHDNRENYDRLVAQITLKSLGKNASVVATGTINVTHNNDGKISGYAYATFSKGGTSAYTPNSGGITTDWTELSTIERQALITKCNDFNSNGNPYMEFTNPASFKLNLRLEFGGISISRNGLTISDKYTFELTDDERNLLLSKCPNSNSLTVRYVIATCYDGSNESAWDYYDRKMSVVDASPIAGELSYKDSNEITVAITQDNQRIIRNNSNLLFSIGSATAKKSATISKYEITINSITKSINKAGDLDFGTINLSSNTIAVLKVIDSRGNIDTKEIEIIIDDWVLPTAMISTNRKNNFYSETYLKVDATYSGLNDKNTIDIKYKYKKVSENEYSEFFNLEDNVQTAIELDNNFQWNVVVILTDKIGTTIYNIFVDRGMPIIFFDRLNNATGINEFPEKGEALRVAGGKTHLLEDLQIDGNITHNNIPLIDTGNNDYGNWIKFYDGTMICFGNFEVDGITTEVWGNCYGADLENVIMFPIEFTEVKSVNITCVSSDGYAFWVHRALYDTQQITALQVSRPNSASNVKAQFSYIAIGKWK